MGTYPVPPVTGIVAVGFAIEILHDEDHPLAGAFRALAGWWQLRLAV